MTENSRIWATDRMEILIAPIFDHVYQNIQ